MWSRWEWEMKICRTPICSFTLSAWVSEPASMVEPTVHKQTGESMPSALPRNP